jgi:PhoPQ-activated pathogenicity-related protein
MIITLPVVFCALARADLAGYVAEKDTSYSWTTVLTSEGDPDSPIRYAELRMVSQTWRGIEWKHRMAVVCPLQPQTTSHALLIISGGSWREGQEQPKLDKESREFKLAVTIARACGMPVAFVMHVPFQPMFGGLKEDQIISKTFDEYLKTGDEEWPLLLPMTKAAVRAMDTVQDFTRKEWKLDISKFIVTGASKRGWTTWLTGATDKRAVAIAPMVIDVLNMAKQMKHQKETYGGYSEEIGDYTRLDLMDRLDTEEGKKLLSLVDPYAYRKRLTMPKLILLGTNDRYWTLDSLNLYYDDLEGEKYILYVPNVGHGLNDMVRVVSSVSAFALKAAGKLEFPRFSWDLRDQADALLLTMRSDVKPSSVSAWVTESPTKDFRDARWRQEVIEPAGEKYEYTLKQPEKGFAAVFGESVYEIKGRMIYLSTNVRIVGTQPASPDSSPKPSAALRTRGDLLARAEANRTTR